jgi:branched-chain amino acid transport system ATP-binding protein
MLEVDGLKAGYGDGRVLFGVDLAVGAGEVVTLLGRNGMGKTTTLSTIIGIVRAEGGEIRFEGAPIHDLPPYRIARLGLGLVPEGRQIFPNLTVRENLVATAARGMAGKGRWTLDSVLDLFPALRERLGSLGALLSGGEQQMLAMGRALMGTPKLLMLDEPSLGLAPIIVADIFRTIGELRTAGVSVLLVEQNAQAALGVADRAYVMELGEFVLSGPARQVATDQRVAASYLGFQHSDLGQRP